MSGVILATAIGSGVAAAGGTAAVVAAGIGAGTTLYGGAKSFSDASKARKRGEAAQRDLLKSMQEAKRRIDVNVYEQLSIPKEPYELMREAALVQGATGMQAGVEGETRGAAATAGRLQMAQQAQQAGIRTAMGEQMMAIDQLVAQDDARIQQQLAGVALEEAAGAAKAIRDAQEDRAAAITQGVTTLGGIAEGLSTAYAEGNFGKNAPPNSKKMLSKKERAPFLAAEEEYDRMMAQRRADAGAFVPYEQEIAGLSTPRSSGLGEDVLGGGFTPPQVDYSGMPAQPQPPPTRRDLRQERRELGISRAEQAQRRADAAAFVPREQERPSGQRVMREDLDPANRVGSVFGDPNIPDEFGPYARNTMTMYDSFSEMPRGPRPLPPAPPPTPAPGQYSGLGFPSYLLYQ